jgi:rod shape-determining protein MreC
MQFPIRIIHALLYQARSVASLKALVFDRREFERLKEEYALLKSEYDNLLDENSRLSALLEFKKKSPLKYVAARIIYIDASNWTWGAVINKGKKSGIKRDDPVVTPDGLLGKVIDVWPDSSHILLLNDPDFAAAAMVKSTHDQGAVVGSLDSRCRMLYVSTVSDVNNGEEVVTSGVKSIFPSGIPIGTIVSVEEDYTGLAYFVIKPFVNINRTEEVLVVIE